MGIRGQVQKGSAAIRDAGGDVPALRALPRTGDAVSSLWIHQGDVLRAYAEKHHDTADIALELPTGTGKTLPGLLIAEWVRRKAAGPVLYAAPTKQLARQVLATAVNEGVPARLLVGSHLSWPVADQSDVANPNVYFVGTNVVSHVAGDVAAVWTDLLAASAQQETCAHPAATRPRRPD